MGERAYLGEAENVFARLKQHLTTKDFWTRVVIVTSKDENLTKAHVRYLEARMIELARSAGRYVLENSAVPQAPSLPRPERDAMEEFLDPTNLLLSALGHPILQAIGRSPVKADAVPSPTELRFAVAKRGIDARGAWGDDGFVIYAGSLGSAELRDHAGKGVVALRERLLADGSLIVKGGALKVTRDLLVTSPSAAAGLLAGGAYNGREAWRTSAGRSLKELEEELAAGTTAPP